MSNEVLTAGETRGAEDTSLRGDEAGLETQHREDGADELPQFSLKISGHRYSVFSSSQEVQTNEEILFSNQLELFDGPLHIFLAQLQFHFNIPNDVTLFLPSLDLYFPINMTFTQQLSLGDLYAIHCEVCGSDKIFEGELIVEKYNFIQQYNKLLERCKKASLLQDEGQIVNSDISTERVNGSDVDVIAQLKDTPSTTAKEETLNDDIVDIGNPKITQTVASSEEAEERNAMPNKSVHFGLTPTASESLQNISLESVTTQTSTSHEGVDFESSDTLLQQGTVLTPQPHHLQGQNHEQVAELENVCEETEERENGSMESGWPHDEVKRSHPQELVASSRDSVDEDIEVDVGTTTENLPQERVPKETLSAEISETFPEDVTLLLQKHRDYPETKTEGDSDNLAPSASSNSTHRTRRGEHTGDFSLSPSEVPHPQVINSGQDSSALPGDHSHLSNDFGSQSDRVVSATLQSSVSTVVFPPVVKESEQSNDPTLRVLTSQPTNELQSTLSHHNVQSSEAETIPLAVTADDAIVTSPDLTKISNTTSHSEQTQLRSIPPFEDSAKISGDVLDDEDQPVDVLSIEPKSQQYTETESYPNEVNVAATPKVGQKRQREDKNFNVSSENEEDDIQYKTKRSRLSSSHYHESKAPIPPPDGDILSDVNVDDSTISFDTTDTNTNTNTNTNTDIDTTPIYSLGEGDSPLNLKISVE
jgi:hypothetical protein